MTEMKRLIPDGVELKDTEGRTISEMRLRHMLHKEREWGERQKLTAPVHEDAKRWGTVHKVHLIGNIQVAQVESSSLHYFAPYIEGEVVGASGLSLDYALLIALCEKYDSDSGILPFYIARMIGLPTKEAKGNA